jgi:uncharacterized delta-60 repeat protein
MQNKTLIKLGLGAILAMALIAGYYGCGGSSSSDSGSSVQTDAFGILDTTFGIGGVVTSTPNIKSYILDTALQTDGKIVVGGYVYDGVNNDFALARYTITGTLDTSFGTNGVVTSTVGFSSSQINGIAIQTDGYIVAAGQASSNGSTYDFALARYTSAGVLDTAFGGGDGVVTTIINAQSYITGIVIQTDGYIVAGGHAWSDSGNKIALARYDSTGVLDTTFGGGDGVITSTVDSDVEIHQIALQTDGKILAGGTAYDDSDWNTLLARYTTAGGLDSTFGGGDGVITSTVGADDRIYALAIQPDGKIVAGGYSYNSSSGYYDNALLRYTSAGALDTAFGGGDGAVTMTVATYTDIRTYDIALQTNGKIVLAGYAISGPYYFMLARYTSAGALDTSFGAGDGLVVELLGTSSAAETISIQPNGYIVVGGSAYSGANPQFALARFK